MQLRKRGRNCEVVPPDDRDTGSNCGAVNYHALGSVLKLFAMTVGKDLLTTQKDGRQSGKTLDMGDSTMANRKDD